MTIAIVACPKCSTLLLSDTVQCHRCRHILRPDQAGTFRDLTLPSDAAVQEDLETCKHCNETYRKGLVRCWSCGAFTRPEIEESYYRLLRGHARSLAIADEHHELREISPEEARRSYLTDDAPSQNVGGRNPTMEFDAVDEDFELSGDISLRDGSPVTADAEAKNSTEAVNGESPAAVSAPEERTNGESPPIAKPVATAPPVDETDSLLHIAKQEESDVQNARKARSVVGSFVVYCPMGCKIRVQERHRGKVGRCPKCQATFVVPMARQVSLSGSVPPSSGDSAPAETAPVAATASKYPHWLEDVHLHRVAPQKLRIKVDSLLNDFQEIDLGFDPQGLLLVAFPKAGGMFGGNAAKKKDEARAAVKAHLASKPTLEGLPAAFQQELATNGLSQMTLIQPPPPGVQSLFGDILVFGAGRIAVQLPKFDDKTTAYLSFSLSQFREFSRLAGEVLGIPGFGAGCGIPLQDVYESTPCHVSKTDVRELQHLTYYQKDPAYKLEVAGYRCKVCGAVISEAARAAQKLGGANGKGIAKAKCPKCTKPMGNQPLYALPTSDSPALSESPDDAAAASAAPTA